MILHVKYVAHVPLAMRNLGMRSTFQSLGRPILSGAFSPFPKCLYSWKNNNITIDAEQVMREEKSESEEYIIIIMCSKWFIE